MRSSLILGVVLLLTIASESIVQARKDCTCGLGSGTNSCKCAEVVVKAARVQKPLYHATPEAINEAAAAREVAQKLSAETALGSVISSSPCGAVNVISNGISQSSSSRSSSSLSSISTLGGLISGGNSQISQGLTFSGGCGRKHIGSLEVQDLLSPSTQGKVVPRFPPIGDLCYPTKHSRLDLTTKVTPAYPVKPRCSSETLNVLNEEIGQKLSLLNSGTDVALGGLTGGSVSSLGGCGGSNSLSGIGTIGTSNQGAFYAVQGGGFAGSSSSISNIGAQGISYGTVDVIQQPTFDGSDYRSGDFGDDLELPEDYSYPRLPADPVSVTLAYKNLIPQTTQQAQFLYSGKGSASQVVHPYYYRKGFIPEDKISFGHRTVPTESALSKTEIDVPEEKLQVLDRPVVELKPLSPVPIAVGLYDEQEEAKLAELEAIERERINQETIAEQSPHFITYGDLGYAPINEISLRKKPALQELPEDAGCAPIGPPVPGYIPGSVVIDREIVETEIESEDDSQGYRRYLEDFESEEDEEIEGTSGLFARVKNIARKYGPSTCLQ